MIHKKNAIRRDDAIQSSWTMAAEVLHRFDLGGLATSWDR